MIFFYLKDLFKLEKCFRTKFFLEKLKFTKMKKHCDPEKFPVKRLNQAKDQKPTFQRSDENSSESISFFVKRINSNEHEKPFNNRR